MKILIFAVGFFSGCAISLIFNYWFILTIILKEISKEDASEIVEELLENEQLNFRNKNKK